MSAVSYQALIYIKLDIALLMCSFAPVKTLQTRVSLTNLIKRNFEPELDITEQQIEPLMLAALSKKFQPMTMGLV